LKEDKTVDVRFKSRLVKPRTLKFIPEIMPAPFMGILQSTPILLLLNPLVMMKRRNKGCTTKNINRFGKVQHIQSIQIYFF
jgi:hypothetical protein